MKKINTIIKEEINKFILNEALSNVAYHFTSLEALVSILKYDRIYLAFSEKGGAEDYDNKKAYFLSLTRQRDGRLGHSSDSEVRITFDGNLLNQNFKGKPINYWGKRGGKNKYMRKLGNDYYTNDFPDELKYQEDTENEDRLFSDMPVINNISRYILRIDIYDMYGEDEIYSWLLNETKFKDIINIYRNKRDFNSLNSKNVNYRYINDDSVNNIYDPDKIPSENVSYRELFIKIIQYLDVKGKLYHSDYDSEIKYIRYLIDKYKRYFIDDDGESLVKEIYRNAQESNSSYDNDTLLHYDIIPLLRNVINSKIIKIATKMLRDE